MTMNPVALCSCSSFFATSTRHFPWGSLLLCVLLATLLGSMPARAQQSTDAGPTVLLLAVPEAQRAKLEMLAALARGKGFVPQIQYVNEAEPEAIVQAIEQAQLILVDWVTSGPYEALLATYGDSFAAHPGVVFPGRDYQRPGLSAGLSAEQASMLFDYYDSGGRDNFDNMFQYLKTTVFGLDTTAAVPP
ncbi:MAG TPA: hypothetical protein VNR18_08215, partial [Hyphomicrobiales bacterium]|nr:hypothetical protein [Hyphomicrobiales bacterium]